MKLFRLAGLAGLLGALLILPGCTETGPDPNSPAPSAANAPAADHAAADMNAPADSHSADANAPANAPADDAAAGGEGKGPVKVTMETSKGTIKLELYPDKAPISVKNFVSYAKKGHYNGTIFHRVIPGFMIQGGGFTPDMKEKPTDAPIKNEADNGLKNDRGTISMARTPEVDSATSQFYINVADNESLNHRGATPDEFGYAVFGKVTEGMDVADKIVSVPTTMKDGHQDVPVEPVVIKSVKVQ